MAGTQVIQEHLHAVQDRVAQCMHIAAEVAEMLAAVDGSSPAVLQQKCEAFLHNIASSQDSVLKVVQCHKPVTELEQTTYHAMAQASIVAEQAEVVHSLLNQAVGAIEASTAEGETAARINPKQEAA